MARRFKSKKRLNLGKLIIIVIIITIIYFLYHSLTKVSVIKPNKKLITHINNTYNKYAYKNKKNNSNFMTAVKTIDDTINNPSTLLLNDLVYNEKITTTYKSDSAYSSSPLIYIYNTHQKEAYTSEYVEDYNINPDVLLMSHIMQERLNNIGIETIVEENDITAYLKNNDMDYSESYDASRVFVKEVLANNSKLQLVIDLHRDAASHDTSTTIINDKACAKVMFVVGREYDTYQNNLNVANNINDKIKNKYPELTRGVLQKEGKGVNGVYNQDLKDNIILLELGADKNNIDELTNTIDLIIPIIKEYINEKA